MSYMHLMWLIDAIKLLTYAGWERSPILGTQFAPDEGRTGPVGSISQLTKNTFITQTFLLNRFYYQFSGGSEKQILVS